LVISTNNLIKLVSKLNTTFIL